MKSTRLRVFLLIALFAVIGVAVSCTLLTRRQSAEVWTPAPVTRTTVQPTRTGAILPAATSASRSATPRPPTATRTAQPTPAAPTATRLSPTATAAPRITPTPDPHLVVITEDDIQRAVASGATAQSGLIAEELVVRFTGGKIRLTASKLAYGPVQMQNLELIGRLVAQNGQLQVETESISPRNLVTALIPTLANQALAQLASQWYVEEVRTLEGRLEVRIR